MLSSGYTDGSVILYLLDKNWLCWNFAVNIILIM